MQCKASLGHTNVNSWVHAILTVNTDCGPITILKMVLVLPMQLYDSGPLLVLNDVGTYRCYFLARHSCICSQETLWPHRVAALGMSNSIFRDPRVLGGNPCGRGGPTRARAGPNSRLNSEMQTIAQLGSAGQVRCEIELHDNLHVDLLVNTNCGTVSLFDMVIHLPLYAYTDSGKRRLAINRIWSIDFYHDESSIYTNSVHSKDLPIAACRVLFSGICDALRTHQLADQAELLEREVDKFMG